MHENGVLASVKVTQELRQKGLRENNVLKIDLA
jgi:hypothetical protein